MTLDLCMTQAVEAYLKSQEERDFSRFRCQYDLSQKPPISIISVWDYGNIAKPSRGVLEDFLSQAQAAKRRECSKPPTHLKHRSSMQAVKIAETDWSLGAMLTPGQVLRLGLSSARDVEVTVRLVVNGVEKTRLEVRKPRGQMSAFIVFAEPLDFEPGMVISFASRNAPPGSVASLDIQQYINNEE